jgi:hypothetical protein
MVRSVVFLAALFSPPIVAAPDGLLSLPAPARALIDADLNPALVSHAEVSTHRFGTRVVIRVRPEVQGIRVEGADRLVIMDRNQTTMSPARPLRMLATFSVDEPVATAKACDAVDACLFRDPTVEDLRGFAHPVWRASDTGLRPAWRVRVPAFYPRDVREVWVDGATGDVIAMRPTAVFGGEGEAPAAPTAASVFVDHQASDPDALDDDLELVQLEGLLPAAIGGHLKGEHFETFNCCKHYTCNDGGSDCITALAADQRPDDVATCAEAGDTGALFSVIAAEVPASLIPVPISIDPVFIRAGFCAELPRLTSASGAGPDSEDGWFSGPVDKDRSEDALAGLASEEDGFAEAQAYHATYVFFQHIRGLLEDPAFCLEAASMACDANGDALLVDGEPTLPFHIMTNLVIPALNFQSVGFQIFQGHGASAEDPVILDGNGDGELGPEDFQRIPNAAFIPALEGGPVQIPPELAPLAALFTRPFDSNVYFQGTRDFAYDGDVVRHEFLHGIVHTLNADLGSIGKDDFGAHAEPGALNEGWADYFSSSFIGNSRMGEYASVGLAAASEIGLRNADNELGCPDAIVGEVHADAEPWTGALWAIREELLADQAKVDALGRALLAAIALSDPDEDFANASLRAVEAIEAEPLLGASVAATALAEFESRGLAGCERVHDLAVLNDAGDDVIVTRKDTLFQPGRNDVGLQNFAPAVVQLRVHMPPKSGGFTLSWGQQAGGIGLGGNNGPAPLLVLVHETAGRVHWSYQGADGDLAVPSDDDGVEIPFAAAAADVQVTVGEAVNGSAPASFVYAIESSCEPRTFIAQILAPEGGAVLSNIDLENQATELDCESVAIPPTAEACGCRGGDAASLSSLALALLGLGRLRRRRGR